MMKKMKSACSAMKNKVLSHLKEDSKEFKKQLADDVKLKQKLKRKTAKGKKK